MRAHASVDIDATRHEVWTELCDIEQHHEWIGAVDSLTFVTDNHTGVGTVFDLAISVGPIKLNSRMIVDRWEEGQALGISREGAGAGVGTIALTQRGNRTNLSWEEEFSLPWWMGGPLGEVVASLVRRRSMKADLGRLRTRINSNTQPGTTEPDAVEGSLVGSGRHGDVHEYGRNRVIRRNRNRASLAEERELMKWLKEHDYPVPRVYDHPDDTAIVMDRIDGPSMLDDLAAKPWRYRAHAKTLAELHDRLDGVEVPPGRLAFQGEGLVHLDLHPGNILLGPDGPVVINWINAGVGKRSLDRAMTWVLMKTDRVDGNFAQRTAAQAVREKIASQYRMFVGDDLVAANATNAAELRMLDGNLRRDEADAVFRLARSLQNRSTHSRTDDI